MLTLNNVSGTFQVCPTSAVFLQSQNSVSYFSTGSNIGLIDSAQAFTFTTSSTMVKWISIITSNSFKTYGAKSAALQSKSNNAHFLQSRTYKVGVTLSYFNNKTYFQIVMSKVSEFKLAKFTLIKKQWITHVLMTMLTTFTTTISDPTVSACAVRKPANKSDFSFPLIDGKQRKRRKRQMQTFDCRWN